MGDAVQARQEPVALREDVPRQQGEPRLVVGAEDPGAEVEEEQGGADPDEQGAATAPRDPPVPGGRAGEWLEFRHRSPPRPPPYGNGPSLTAFTLRTSEGTR